MSGRRPRSPFAARSVAPARSPFAARTVLAALALALALGGCASPQGDRGAQRGGSSVGHGEAAPEASPFWVDPDSEAARQVARWERQGRAADARVLRRIADRPVAVWPSGADPVPQIEHAVRGATAEGRTPVLVAYNIPHRDCGLYSAGGAADASAYRTWIHSFATALGRAPAVVILEPDAIAHLADGCTPAEHHEERYTLLAQAVSRLKQQPRTRVYLDAGNPAWISDPARLAGPLQRAGVNAADGFALNVSNFQSNGTVRAFGARLSALLGGSHFTVDTSRNGQGPLPGNRAQAWCNPPGRALGTPPTTRTGDKLVDAYLWIKRPGESDGPCRGGPPAGTWWPDYALGLARRATN
ncbi:glycoside hydrolase family 6 protein [Streptomyces liangshanensis]|uniref:Glucanase n=1 Tax=Streptomyces liangshanensis TaxID=2717324 RepID=A0A6G9GX60_9ACTN|nr:glycoside hydrolase family 6 protein [Streptomyces liangshanensis]QIQ02639.1 glycoside hydrolase family 6 protein [Streptomyces liangshanensis]